jgi:hypothetical protein
MGQITKKEMALLIAIAFGAWACILVGAWALGKLVGVSIWHWVHP